jgi:hypothetical protein
MCKTLITPVATYGAKSWALNKSITKRPAVSEGKLKNFGENSEKAM